MLIYNGTVVTVNKQREILEKGAVAISDGKILDLGDTALLKAKYGNAQRILDAEHKAVFPGLINMHSHSYQSLLKGLGDDRVLADWLADMSLPAAEALDAGIAYWAALLTAWENIHSGVTTVVDMFPRIDAEISDAVIRAYRESGLRGVFAAAYMHNEDSGPAVLDKTRENLCRLLALNQQQDSRVHVMLAPFQVWNNSPSSLGMTRELADKYQVGLTLHALETAYDGITCSAVHGASELETLDRYGLIRPSLTMVHGVLASSEEISLLASRGVSVVYTPVCNMYLASGFMPAPEMLNAGVNVVLGTEGAGCNNSNDMLETLKSAALVQKALHKDPLIITAEAVLEMATIQGARALGLGDQLGSLEIGKKADMFIFDPRAALKAVPMHHPVSTLVYSASDANVDTVIIGGEVVLEQGKPVGLNEKALATQAQLVADMLAEKAHISHLKKRPWRNSSSAHITD